MSVAVTVTSVDYTQNCAIVRGTLTLSGSYVAHGDSISFSGSDFIKSQSTPLEVQIWEAPAAGTSPTGYVFKAFPNGILAALLTIFTSNGASPAQLNELAAGAYGGPLTGAALNFTATFPSL
jgi:hypothetical protein